MMSFIFENDCKKTEALVTGIKYYKKEKLYILTVLGLDEDGFSYTINGKAWFETEDFDELIQEGEFETPFEIIGRRLKFVAENLLEDDPDELDLK